MRGSLLLSRITSFAFTVLLASLVIFLFLSTTNEQRIEQVLVLNGQQESVDYEKYLTEYERLYRKNNFDKALFFFSILPKNYPSNVREITNPDVRNSVKKLLNKGYDYRDIKETINKLPDGVDLNSLMLNKQVEFSYFPKFYWHGFENQYWYWIKDISSGNFNLSSKDGLPVLEKIGKAMSWTLTFVTLNVIFSLVLSYFLLVSQLSNLNSWWSKITDNISLLLMSIPAFWLATLAVIYLTNDYYGIGIFKGIGIWNNHGDSVFYYLPKLILPLLVVVILDIAVITKIVKDVAIDEYKKPYIMTLRSKGVGNAIIGKQHILKNSIIPTITVITGSVAHALTGSLLIEVIFNIPGMGRLMYDSILNHDFNTLTGILFISVVITVFFYSLGDVLYRLANPKILIQ
ncbi:MAG TPA: ABC transporter permease [Saprospiraceae bacterium]|nr:ABC transporter permease [Saprospiraceae bacterium]